MLKKGFRLSSLTNLVHMLYHFVSQSMCIGHDCKMPVCTSESTLCMDTESEGQPKPINKSSTIQPTSVIKNTNRLLTLKCFIFACTFLI